MTATTDHPAEPELERVREARDTLVELRDYIPDDDGSQRSFALAEVVRTWNASEDDPIWVALTELIPPRTDEPVDEACEQIRRSAVKLLEALWDAEYQRRDDEGLSLATYGKLSRAHDEIGRALDLIRLEA
jgi:hypothetical protein